MSAADAVIKGITGRRAKETTWSHQVKDLIKAFGKDGARAVVGVSESTWRRWTSGRGGPSKANLAKLGNSWNSRDVRAAMIPKRRANKAAGAGFKVKLTGVQGPTSDPKYARLRSISADLPAEAAQAIMDAFVEGGPEAANEALREAMAEHYYGSMPGTSSTMDDLTDIKMSARDDFGGSFFDDFDE